MISAHIRREAILLYTSVEEECGPDTAGAPDSVWHYLFALILESAWGKFVCGLFRLRPEPWQEPPMQSTRSQAGHRFDEPHEMIAACRVCGQRLRIPAASGSFYCPTCKTEFTTVFNGSAFALLFAPPPEQGPQEDAPEEAGEAMTLEDAYLLFEGGASTPWATIVGARRRLLRQYHPDQIATMGPKLLELAEAECKRINLAFTLIRQARMWNPGSTGTSADPHSGAGQWRGSADAHADAEAVA